ncbi:MAG: helicase-related protein, partial [Bacteroidia bacterium]|nr:helicase-related protein [Bacteroidia bacterium]
VITAHGQMPGSQMEEVMELFIDGAYDVLVCTTIIESGLDIPNVNTIFINEAQNFGLSDLHQMRGRVGRSNIKAYCYLIAPQRSELSSDAIKRLSAMEQFSDLGSGIQIAMRDLDIRGAGDVFGAEQSGFINDIGAEVYHQILDEAVKELKEEQFSELFREEIAQHTHHWVEDCQFETDSFARIPEDYMPSASERLIFYKRISTSEKEEQLIQIRTELEDRFGPLPEPILNLFDSVRIRETARQLGFEKLTFKENQFRAVFPSNPNSNYYQSPVFSSLLQVIQKNRNIQLKQAGVKLTLHGNANSLSELLELLRTFASQVILTVPVNQSILE